MLGALPENIAMPASTRRRCAGVSPAPGQGELAQRAQSLPSQPGRCAAAPPRASAAPEAMSWLLDTDVICQPAKRHGDPRVIAWLEEEQDRCYTSAVVIAQLSYWVGTKEDPSVGSYRYG